MNFIKQIFEGKADDNLHHKFTRYGKGEYERLFFIIKKGKNLRVNSSWDFSNDFFKLISENATEPMAVTGKVIANYDLEKDLPCEAEVTKRGKLYTASLNCELTPEQMKEIYEKFEKQFILLNVKGKDFKLKVGKSLPKPGGKIKDNFCMATLPLKFIDEFAFDFDQDFKEARIVHILNITEIVVSRELLETDPARARLEAKRKGKIIRKITIDEKETVKEAEFEL